MLKCLHRMTRSNLANNSKKMTTNSTTSTIRTWYPEKIISGAINKHVCLVLNRRIGIPADIVTLLWELADIRCLVDGGTNRWYTFLKENSQAQTKPPDFVTGDFDSISQEASKYFDDNQTQRIHTPDQNETDFTKSLRVLKPHLEERNISNVIAFHDTSGRLDQIMANINTLFKANDIFMNNLSVYLLNGNSLSWLLNPGEHSIHIPAELVENKRWCALIPIGRQCTVTTTGLKWNMSERIVQFGGMVSTSNTYAETLVKIRTSDYLLWSMGIYNFDDD